MPYAGKHFDAPSPSIEVCLYYYSFLFFFQSCLSNVRIPASLAEAYKAQTLLFKISSSVLKELFAIVICQIFIAGAAPSPAIIQGFLPLPL